MLHSCSLSVNNLCKLLGYYDAVLLKFSLVNKHCFKLFILPKWWNIYLGLLNWLLFSSADLLSVVCVLRHTHLIPYCIFLAGCTYINNLTRLWIWLHFHFFFLRQGCIRNIFAKKLVSSPPCCYKVLVLLAHAHSWQKSLTSRLFHSLCTPNCHV